MSLAGWGGGRDEVTTVTCRSLQLTKQETIPKKQTREQADKLLLLARATSSFCLFAGTYFVQLTIRTLSVDKNLTFPSPPSFPVPSADTSFIKFCSSKSSFTSPSHL